MSFPIPDGLTLQSLEKDSVTLTVDATHSVLQPHFVIIDRRTPTFNNGAFSQPRYRIRVIRGNLDGEGQPTSVRTLADLELAWRVDNTSEYVEDSILDPLELILETADFASLVFGQQALPTCCVEPEAP